LSGGGSPRESRGSPILDYLEAVDHGRFGTALNLLKDAGLDARRADLLKGLDALEHEDHPPSRDSWQAMRSSAVKAGSSEAVSFWPSLGDPGLLENTVVSWAGEVAPEELTDGTRLNPGPGQRTLIAIRGLDGAATVVANLLVRVEKAVDDRLSVRAMFDGQDDEHLLRLRARGVVVAGSLELELRPRAGPRLYTIVLSGSGLTVFIDGVLRWRRERLSGQMPDAVAVDLYPSPVEQDVHLMGLSIDVSETAYSDWLPDDDRPAVARAQAAADLGDARALYHCLYATPGVRLPEVTTAKALELCAQTSEPRGFLPWIVDELARALPDHLSSSFRERALADAPSPAISVEDLTVTFSTDPSIDKSLYRILRRERRTHFDVLDELNFTIYPGDICAIIGKNGAGKSTLLRTLTGAIPIRRGRVLVSGSQVLLRPGAGMREHLSGRQNIVNSGIYMGLTLQQIRDIEADVIEFSELGSAIDRPYRYYSDGMRSRLIFSLATAVSPEILMLDELLGAGDIGFQEKAMARLNRFIESAKVVLVVQHGGEFARKHCNKVLYLAEGRQVFFGDPDIGLELYYNEVTSHGR
jgi:ABC-type polysaccharide/polyol phosphate transport system ATPase subunit